MYMEIVQVHQTSFDEAVKKAVKILSLGGVIIYPTDTVYGIGADAFNEEAVRKVRIIKGREDRRPLSVMVSHVEVIEEHAHMTEVARRLATRHLPGALSIVLRAKDHVPESITLHGTLGVRIPNSDFALALARAFPRPIISTSANKTGYQTPRTIFGILEQLKNNALLLDICFDGGEHEGGTPSTVVSCVAGEVQVLREGAIMRKDITDEESSYRL